MMEEGNHLTFHGSKGEIIFVVMTILYIVVARFLAVLSHEVLGHGLVSELIGGEFYAVYVSPGHRIDLKNSIRWVLQTCRVYRLPEPLRQAHIKATQIRSAMEGSGSYDRL